MFDFIRKWRNRKHIRRIEALHNIPSLLQQMDERLLEVRQQQVHALSDQQLDEIALDIVKKLYPESLVAVQLTASETGISEARSARFFMETQVTPEMMASLKAKLDANMAEIETCCQELIDEELGTMQKKKGKPNGNIRNGK